MKATQEVKNFIGEMINDPIFQSYFAEILVEMCRIDSTPKESTAELRKNEEAVFNIIKRCLNTIDAGGELKEYYINHEEIKNSEAYTPIYYSKDQEPYMGRYNLVYHYNSPGKGNSLAFNAHIDTVPPHLEVKRDGKIIVGRGSCDDKGNIVCILAIIKILNEAKKKFGVGVTRELTCMFVIDEETGGNGSLALALDKTLKKSYDELVVLECTDNQIHPANRGGLWYKIELPLNVIKDPLLVIARILLSFEKMGKQINAESDHPLFPNRPTPTGHGIWGPWGEHPSRVCGYVEINLETDLEGAVIKSAIEKGLKLYTDEYGNKTKTLRGGKPITPWHFKLEKQGKGYILKIMGSTGHMGAVKENDGALTKAAFIIQELDNLNGDIKLKLAGDNNQEILNCEGGQGFLPTHPIAEIKKRIWEATTPILVEAGIPESDLKRVVTFDKLHNDSFCSDPESDLVKRSLEAAKAYGMEQKGPLRGWNASCDARLFSQIYPDLPIITVGAGNTNSAHSNAENVDITELYCNAGVMALLAFD